ncbi:TIGR03086 family metal-binding protein [Cellulomonas sp. NS3]|uniref:TIGR03086 family metal-binding protein n=1 Tax=Cellulomonas sp. NS3 TaxID=2973977 RepID=UPI00216214F5|nr:TIGR03086 family metal-binding protein [Cellulomonas sp. NS3]
MDELLSLHRVNAERFSRLVHRVGPPDSPAWRRATPCTDWTVRDLVNHLTSEQLWAPELLAGRTVAEVGDRFDGDVLGEDPVAAWDAAIAAALAAFAEAGALGRTVDLSRGPTAAHDYLDEMLTDLAVHGWDLARGLGVEDDMDPSTVDRLLVEWSDRTDELGPGSVFAGPLDVPDGADQQTRLLALFGRRA